MSKKLVPAPEEDMPEAVKTLYLEAASIVRLSPRASLMLIHQAFEMLVTICNEAVYKEKKLTQKINRLIAKDISDELKHHLYMTRLIDIPSFDSNLSKESFLSSALEVFTCMNFIVVELITAPKMGWASQMSRPKNPTSGIE